MHENDVTDLLLDAIGRLSPIGQRRLLHRALGVRGLPAETGALEIGRRTRSLDTRAPNSKPGTPEPRTVLVTITGDPTIASADLKQSPGSEIDGILLWRGALAVLIEVKLPGNPVSRNQLHRHAQTWGLPLDELDAWTDPEDPPDGFGWVSWEALLVLLDGGLGTDNADEKVVSDVAARLRSEVGGGAAVGPACGKAVVPQDVGTTMDLDALLSGVDLRMVYETALCLYGPAGSNAVVDSGCLRDASIAADGYRQEGRVVPPGLLENGADGLGVMTPRRLLTWAYQGSRGTMLSGAVREVTHRLVSRGADRRVLVALWAWTIYGASSAQRAKTQTNLQVIWPKVPPISPAAPELEHLALPDHLLAPDDEAERA